MPASPPTRCPCGSGRRYDACCGRLHRGEAEAVTAEELMRSRFSAFAVRDEDYLRRSWDPTTCPRRIRLDPERRWTELEIVATTGGGMLDREGTVEFRAHHEHDGLPGVLHETSRFRRDDGRWVYVTGE